MRLLLVGVLVVVALGATGTTSRTAGNGQSGWVVTDLGKWSDVFDLALNARGDVVLTRQAPGSRAIAFLLRHGRTVKLGENEAIARDLNERGQIVGWSDKAGGGFLWQNGKFIPLSPTGWPNSNASALNDRGDVVGDVDRAPNGGSHAFVWRAGRVRDLGALGGRQTFASDINERGQIVGETYTESEGYRLFIYRDGKMTRLGTGGWTDLQPGSETITDDGQVFGVGTKGRFTGHFLWDRGTMIGLGRLGGRETEAGAINDRGQIVGAFRTAGGHRHAFLWQSGKKLKDLGTLGGGFSEASAISDDGHVVGTSATASGASRLFLWKNGRMTTPDTPASGDLHPLAVNNRGQILARRRDHLVLVSPPQTK